MTRALRSNKGISRTMLATVAVVIIIMVAGGFLAYQAINPPAPAPENITLRIWTHYTGNASNPIRAFIAEYMQLHPNIKIDYEAIDYDQMTTKLPADFIAGNLPDIIHWGGTADLVTRGIVIPAPQDISDDVKAKFGDLGVELMSYGGKVYGYPDEAGNTIFIYNSEMFEKAGIANPPATWDELDQDLQKLSVFNQTGGTVQLGFGIPNAADENTAMWEVLVWSNGGEIYSQNPPRVLWNSTEAVEVTKLIRSWIDKGYVDPQWITYDQGIVKEKIASTIVASWFGHWVIELEAPEVYPKFKAAPVPYNPERATHGIGSGYAMGMYVTSQAKHPNEAWAFLKWLNGPWEGHNYTRMTAQIAEGVGMPSWDKTSHHPMYDTPWFKPFVEELRTPGHTKALPSLKGASEIEDILHKALEKIWFENADIKATLDEATAEANRILAENYPG